MSKPTNSLNHSRWIVNTMLCLRPNIERKRYMALFVGSYRVCYIALRLKNRVR